MERVDKITMQDEQLEANIAKTQDIIKRLDAKARAICSKVQISEQELHDDGIEDDADPQKTHAYMDIMIGRDIGKDPKLTRGRLIFELFEDLMPRTVEQFIRMLESKSEPTYSGSAISKVFPGYMCEAGDRTSKVEGGSSTGK